MVLLRVLSCLRNLRNKQVLKSRNLVLRRDIPRSKRILMRKQSALLFKNLRGKRERKSMTKRMRRCKLIIMDRALIVVKLAILYIDKARVDLTQLVNKETCSMTRDRMVVLPLNPSIPTNKAPIRVKMKVPFIINHSKSWMSQIIYNRTVRRILSFRIRLQTRLMARVSWT